VANNIIFILPIKNIYFKCNYRCVNRGFIFFVLVMFSRKLYYNNMNLVHILLYHNSKSQLFKEGCVTSEKISGRIKVKTKKVSR